MFRLAQIGVTVTPNLTSVSGYLLTGETLSDGRMDPNTAKVWDPATVLMNIRGCSHGLSMTQEQFMQGAAHIACCAIRGDSEALAVAQSPCVTQVHVVRHFLLGDGNPA
jgi:hypothetical protein